MLCTFGLGSSPRYQLRDESQRTVYLVSNRISSLPEIADLIHKIADASGHWARTDAARGSREESLDFINYDYDVFSRPSWRTASDSQRQNHHHQCAHHFGLSDSSRCAVAWAAPTAGLLLPPGTAQERAHAEERRASKPGDLLRVGSGFNLALQDSTSRGAGNCWARAERFMEDLGYETYQMISAGGHTQNEESESSCDEIKTRQGDAGGEFLDDCAVESDLECTSRHHVPGSSERMLLTRARQHRTDDELTVPPPSCRPLGPRAAEAKN